MNDVEGVLLFAGVPFAVVAVTFALVFLRSDKPSTEPIVKPIMDDDRNGSAGPR